MNRQNAGTSSHLFSVRVWSEEVEEGHAEWRGKVHHILTGEQQYFRDWTTLIAFLEKGFPLLAESKKAEL